MRVQRGDGRDGIAHDMWSFVVVRDCEAGVCVVWCGGWVFSTYIYIKKKSDGSGERIDRRAAAEARGGGRAARRACT
jgi:hypothetical protein